MTSAKGRAACTWSRLGVMLVMVIAPQGCVRHDCCAARLQAAGACAAEPVARAVEAAPAQQPRFGGPAPAVNVYGEVADLPASMHAQSSTETGFQQHTWIDEGHDNDVAVSPDARWIAFSSTRHHERGDIYVQRVDGLSVTQLTNDPADDANPVFSADGRRIAFCSTRAGNWDIYVMDSDGRNVVQLTHGPAHEMHPSFAPDGQRLVYCSTGSRSGQWELWTLDLRSGQKRMIGYGLFPHWSPDSSRDRIAFQRARARGSRWFSLWTLELVDGEPRHVTEVAVSTNAAIVSPSWSPDGRRLAFSTIVEPGKDATGKPTGQQDIWTINLDGTQRRRLTDGHGAHASPFWGADDRVYFISDRGGRDCIWSVSANFSTPPTLNALGDEQSKPDSVGSAD